jgi:hypothetical protein
MGGKQPDQEAKLTAFEVSASFIAVAGSSGMDVIDRKYNGSLLARRKPVGSDARRLARGGARKRNAVPSAGYESRLRL